MRLSFLLIVCAIAVFLSSGVRAEEEETSSPPPTTNGVVRVGDMAPHFTLTTLDGKQVGLADSVGKKPTVLVFWSYFCFPCQAEMPILQEYYSEMGTDKISIIAVSLDGHCYDNFVLPFVAENKLTFPIAYDRETKEFFEIAEKFGVVGTPTFFIIDDQGRIRFIQLGRLEKEILRGVVDGVKSKSFCAEIVKPEIKKPE
jgi:peroxiredoxin